MQMLVNTVAKRRQPADERRPDRRAATFDAARSASADRPTATGCGCTPARSTAAPQSEFTAPPDCRFTQRGDRLYLHLFAWPFAHVHLDGFAGKVAYAQLLNDASEIKLLEPGKHSEWSIAEVAGDTLTLELPVCSQVWWCR